MISFKKSYAEQMLQLALALSLLQVDPENYYGHGWDTHLPLRNGDGWQLEMLRASPISEYPYANRKAIMPLIEDLVRFDRQRNMDEITAYLLNVQNANDQNTGGGQEHNSTATGAATATVTVENPNNNSSGATMIQELDLFLNHDHFVDFASIPEQNIADLRDYGEIPLNSMPYLGLPLKDEPPDPFASFPLDIEIKQELPSTSATSELGSLSPERTNSSGSEDNPESASASVKFRVKKERNDSGIDDADEDDEEKSSASPSSEDIKQEVTVKREPELDEDDEDDNDFNRGLFDFSDFFNEESEIVDVLWKQDVDLGFSLSPLKITNGNNDTPAKTVEDDDDVEKLKALQALKNDKSKDEDAKDVLEDEWAGIRFTIDNETGEYIQLQFDEILQDVLQLPDLTTEDQEVKSENDNDLSKQKSGENPSDPNPGVEEKDSSDLTDLLTQSDDCPTGLDEPPQTEVEISSQSPIFDLEDASALDEIEMMIQSAGPFQHHRPGQNYATNSAFRQSGFHHHHHHPHQSRVPLSRSVSMEQRFQDIANLFNPIPTMGVGMGVSEMSPYSHYPTHYPYQTTPGLPQHGQFQHPAHPVLHNASLADLGASQPHYGHNLGSAVSSSMHITNSSHEGDAGATGYKMEHDMMYYSNTSSELNHTTDGFINSILNDEDLHLMDMGVNEGFCSMRMLEGNTGSNNSSVLGSGSSGSHGSNILSMPPSLGPLGGSEAIGSTGDRLDASSDSAVSSMGSERVPSLSDGEWGDIGSDSAQEYHQGKYGGPYDYSYNSRLGDSVKQPVAQKKHQMFGKRYFQEQPNIPNLPQPSNGTQPTEHMPTSVKYEYEPYRLHQTPSLTHNMEGAVGPLINKDHVPLMTHPDMKYACSLDFSARQPRTAHDLINHNHTYTLPQGSGSTPRPQLRDKKQRKAEEEHLTRDEKRARALNIPITVNDIINLPMDEFNERLSKYDLSENQLSLIRDIRRRGKNKVAAQNCRKRKLDQILSLEDEVKEVRRRKDRLLHEHEVVYNERKRIAEKFAALHRHVFQYLRDSEGNPCSPSQYSLQQAADGSVYLLRRENKPDGSTAATNHTAHGNSSNHHHASGPSPPSSHHQKE